MKDIQRAIDLAVARALLKANKHWSKQFYALRQHAAGLIAPLETIGRTHPDWYEPKRGLPDVSGMTKGKVRAATASKKPVGKSSSAVPYIPPGMKALSKPVTGRVSSGRIPKGAKVLESPTAAAEHILSRAALHNSRCGRAGWGLLASHL